jgi:hypothetical protein
MVVSFQSKVAYFSIPSSVLLSKDEYEQVEADGKITGLKSKRVKPEVDTLVIYADGTDHTLYRTEDRDVIEGMRRLMQSDPSIADLLKEV